MKLKSLWSGFRQRAAATGRPRIRMQALGLTEPQLRALRPVVDRLGECLELLLELDSRQGEIVLAEQHFARHTAPQQLAALCDARPLITCDLGHTPDRALSALALLEQRQRELLRQLRELPIVRGLSPQFGASGWDPEVVQASQLSSDFGDSGLEAPSFDAAQQAFVSLLLKGLWDPAATTLLATYGPRAVLRVNFAQAYALIDPVAQQRLRVHRDLPRVVNVEAPGAEAIERELDELVWDVGIACGAYRLLDQPRDWWHAPLAACPDPARLRYTRLPRHLALARLLFGSAPVTPAELQRRSGQTAAEMQPFLQACLFLGLAWWAPQT